MVVSGFLSSISKGCARGLTLAGSLVLAMTIGVPTVEAQQTSCARIARDMRALESGHDAARPAQLRRQAQKTAAQALKITAEMERIGCGNTRFLLWGNDPPAQCPGLQARVNQLSQRANALLAQAERSPATPDPSARLATLTAAYEARGCNDASEQAAGTETPLPAIGDLSAPKQDQSRPVLPISGSKAEQRATAYAAGAGAPGAVCVRLCDGFFFPLSGARSRSQANDMCQAQCPATETQVYFRRGSNIATAFSIEGKSYSAMPNAFSFQTSYNPDCSCRQPGENWAEALQGAERMVSARGKPDLVVDEKIAAQWAEIQKSMLRGKGKKGKAEPAPEAEAVAAEAPAEAEPAQEQATAEEAQQEPPSTATAGDDALGSVIEELDTSESDQPLPPAIDPVDEGRETMVQIIDDLPPLDSAPAQ